MSLLLYSLETEVIVILVLAPIVDMQILEELSKNVSMSVNFQPLFTSVGS